MAFIIVFTIFCEQTLAAGRRWTNYHNPLMQPFLDKVVSELMILGSTAFAILIYNECTENSLSVRGPQVYQARDSHPPLTLAAHTPERRGDARELVPHPSLD